MTNIVKLKDICEFLYGKGLPQREREKGEFPVYGSGGIVDYHKTFLIEGPGIIVGRKGTIGSVFFEKRKFYPIDTVYYIRANESLCDTKYLYYSLLTLGLNKLNTDAAVPGLNRNVAYEQKLFLPPKALQEKIASILSAYDDLIENNNRRIKILEEMAQAIYREWFVNFRFPGHEKVKMVKSKLGMIPEGWEVVKIGDILRNIKRRTKIQKNEYLDKGEIPTVDQGATFIGGYTNNTDALHDDPLPIVIFGDHTRVVKYVDFPFASGADGTQLLYPSNEELMPAYFYYAIKNIDLSNYAYARHFKFLRAKELFVPKNPALELFNKTVGAFLGQMSLFRKRNVNLRKTRDLLLPKLISGEIDVSQIG